jgi:hypothetical protein
MRDKRITQKSLWILIALMCVGSIASCTGAREHSRLLFTRYTDSVRVALDPSQSATWSPTQDSVVVLCTECYQGKSMATFNFQDRNSVYLSSDTAPMMTLIVYRKAQIDTTYRLSVEDLTDQDMVETTPMLRHQKTPRRHGAAVHVASDEPNKTPLDTKIVVAPKKATMLRIVAKEGVAIYKDKSKREVIKILPLGATLPYLSREGDLYSVVVGDAEGFVEAAAVQVVQ